MTISKHIHSCLLIEDQGKTVLIDPGIFTAQAKALPLESLPKLDYITITHEHADHMYLPLLHELVEKFPNVKIITNASAAKILNEQNIQTLTSGDEIISYTDAPHEKLWDAEVPQNIVINLFGRLTHPGDSLHFSETSEILALPIQAPWGSTTAAVTKALELKPKIIIPIHDWMWKDEIRLAMHQRLKEFFSKHEIRFESLETGKLSL
jgi:L-ascorbate metabolism protein UlaG (beta-lactamase superfamily)